MTKDSVKFVSGRKKTRGELRLPQLHFIVLDDWQDKIGKDAIWAWLQFYTWADRSQSEREHDVIPNSMNKIQKKLGVGKGTFYNKIIRPLWNHGLIDLQEIELKSKGGHNPVNIIVYEYPQNDPALATRPIKPIRDYDKDYKTETRKTALKGGRPKKEEGGSSHTELPDPSSHTKLPLVPVQNYPSSVREHNNVLNQSNVLNDYNEMNKSQSINQISSSNFEPPQTYQSQIESESIKSIILKNQKMLDRLTDIETVYLAIKEKPGYSEALFIQTLFKANEAKISVPFKHYFLKAMMNNVKAEEATTTQAQKKKTDMPEWIVNQSQSEQDTDPAASSDQDELTMEQKLEATELLYQLNEIDEQEYKRRKSELIG
ncbi:hypothetical protein BEP19_16735 [Ammoniphilus oxalaticus]|uniref:Uncharacterized protein n=1 Tax=Ammoniphilus oxalaticus TaxID=66863 RepID=A0A419SQ84_9BACL|nr:hypothetical protein [Ammoniphilus oxalaticus]RKD26484.1 hypothetical protein BEP19_16735 [Ammoniphilus oxalaticus]